MCLTSHTYLLQWLELYHWSKTYGPVMHLSLAGQPLIVLSTNQAAQDLLSRRSRAYSDRPRLVMAGELVTRGMHMLLRPYDEQYKLHQRMQAPLLLSARAASAQARASNAACSARSDVERAAAPCFASSERNDADTTACAFRFR